jgi:RHS repeat-associated protein
MRKRLVRRVIPVLAVVLALNLGIPHGQLWPDGPGLLQPLKALARYFAATMAWAAADPPGPPKVQRGVSDGASQSTSAATRANGGNPPATFKGPGVGLAPEDGRYRPNSPAFETRLRTGFVPGKSTMVPESSTEASTLYRNPDGSYTNRVFQIRTNYKASDGKYYPIDPTLVPGTDGRLKVAAHAINVTVPAGNVPSWGAGQSASSDPSANPDEEAGARAHGTELVSITFPTGQSFGYELQGARIGTSTVDRSMVRYENVLPDTDIEIVATQVGVEDTLILKHRGGPNSWVFPLRLDGITARVESGGSIVLLDAVGKKLARIPTGIMQDSKVQPDGEFATSQGIAYELITVDGKPAMKVTADTAWLNDPARVYPVRIDPPAQLWDDTGDAYVTQNDTRWGENSLGLGCYNPGSGCDHRRTFLAFDNFTSYAYGPPNNNLAGMRITGAALHIFHTWSEDCPSTRSVYAYRVTQNWGRWDGSGGSALMPNGMWPGAAVGEKIGEVYVSTNYNACLNTSGDRTVGNWWTIPVTNLNLFNDWSRDPGQNFGIALTSDNDEDRKGWKRIVSRDYDPSYGTNAPYIDFQWEDDVPPQIDKLYPPMMYGAQTLTPELIIQAKDPDNWPGWGLKYTYKVWQGQTLITESAANIPQSSWKVPDGKLMWGESYSWTADVFDGYKYSSSFGYFNTPVPQPLITSSLSQNGGNGFTPTTGNYTTSVVDAEVPTIGPALTIERYYNSRDPRTDNVFGAGWSSLLDAKAVDLGTQVIVTYPTGESVAFGKNWDGTYSSPLGKFATLKPATGGGFELVDKSGTTYTFKDTTTAGEFGITAITDAQNRQLSFGYTGSKITSLTSASGRKLFIEWAADNKHVARTKSEELTAGVPASQNVWEYTYTGDKLDKVCPPTSATACSTYLYTANTLHPTAVMDARPQTYLRLNEASGAVAKSSVVSLDTATGTYLNNVTLNQPGRPGSANVATFNGSNQVVELTAKKLALAASYQSVSLWFKTSNPGVLYSYQSMAMGAGGSQWNPALYVDTNGKLRGVFWQGSTDPMGKNWPATVNNNAWHHAVLTATGNTQSLYLDGQLVDTRSGNITPNGTSYAYLGGGKWESWDAIVPGTVFNYFNGSLSDFAWYDQPLTIDQVKLMYVSGNSASYVLNQIKRPSGNVQATINYETDASVKDVTDANGGVWRLAPSAITASDVTYASTVQAQTPHDYFRFKESGVQVPINEMNGDEADPGLYSGVTLGVDGGPFGDDIDVASFDGDDVVKLPKKDYPNGGAAHSVSMWFKTTGSGVLYGAQSKALGDTTITGGWMPGIYVSVDGKLRGGYWAGGQSVSPWRVNDGAWHHVALAVNGTKQTIYLDGVSLGTKTATLNAETFTDVFAHVGAGRWKNWDGSSGDEGFFTGQISEFAYFRSELTFQQVQMQVSARDSDRSAGAAPSVAAINAASPRDYFQLAETSGTVAVNQVSGGPSATYGNVTLGDQGPFGTAATAPTFNGSYVALPSRDYPNGNTPSSVSLWFRTTVKGGVLYTAQQYPIFTIDPKNYAHQPGLYVGTDGKLWGGFWPSNQIASGREVADGSWHHAVLSTSGTQQTLYLDGIPQGTTNSTAETFSPVYAYLGNGQWESWNAVNGTHGQLFGQIAEFAYYPTQLSQVQVTAQYVARDRAKNMPVRQASVTDPVNGVTKYLLDVYSGRQIAQIDAGGGRTSFGYDKGGFLYSVTDPNGNVTITEHDTHGNTVAETTCLDRAATDPCSTVYTSYYTDGLKADLVETIRDGRSSSKTDDTYKTTYARDDKGNVTSITDPLSRTQAFDYTNDRTIYSEHDFSATYGRYIRINCSAYAFFTLYSLYDFEIYGLDHAEDLAAFKNVTASSTNEAYILPASYAVDKNPLTRWASTSNAPAQWITVDLNGWYYVNRVVLAWEQAYAQNYKIEISGDNSTWFELKNVVGQDPTKVPAGLVRAETSPGGAITRRVYNKSGDLVRSVSPEGLRIEYKYDRLGRVTEKKEFTDRYPNGLTTSMTYDRLNRLETQKEPTVTDRIVGAQHTKLTTLLYNNDGQLWKSTVSDSQPGSIELARLTEFQYNSQGQKWKQIDPEGNNTEWFYDAMGRMTRQVNADLTEVRAEYTPLGKLWKTTVPGNPQPLETRAYDPAGRLQSITDANLWQTVYKYTDNDLVASVTRLGPSGATYVNQTDKYDRAGKLYEQWTNNGQTYTKYEVDAASRPTTTTVDPSGVNRVSTYTYGLDNQLLSMKLTGSGGQQVVDGTYDKLGRRISQSVSTNGTNGLVARWKLNDGTGTTAADSSGNRGATGTYASSAERNGSAYFDGVDDRMETNGPVVDTSQSYTVSAWVKMETDADFQGIVSMRGENNDRAFSLYYFKWGASKLWSFSAASADEWIPSRYYDAWSSNPVQLNTWTHLVGVFNTADNSMRLYVNGVANGVTFNNSAWRGKGKVMIGAHSGGSYFKGNIDDVQVYQRALTPADITALYGGNDPVDQKVLRNTWMLDRRGLPIAQADAMGNTTSYDYDESGRIALTSSPTVKFEVNGGAATDGFRMESIAYNTFGEAVESKDPNGQHLISQRNKNGQVTQTWMPGYTLPDGGPSIGDVINTNEFDSMGRVKATVDPLGNRTTLQYDEFGRLKKRIYPNLGETNYSYDLNGKLIQVIDPNGTRTTAAYDFLGREISTSEWVGTSEKKTLYGYHVGGWRSSVTPPGRNSTTFEFNGVGETKAAIDAAAYRTEISYDFAGRQVEVREPDGVKQQTTYDFAGRPVEVKRIDSDGTTLLANSLTAYDPNGNVTSATDPKGNTTKFEYDATGYLTKQTQPVSTSALDDIVTTFGYDLAGSRTRFTDGRGNNFFTRYNSWGLPEKEIEPGDYTYTTVYDKAGQPVELRMPGGVTQTSTYNNLGRLTAVTGSGAEAATVDRAFEYDTGGRLISASGIGTIGYDERGLLFSVGGATFSYTDDGLMASRADAAGTTDYTYDTAARLRTVNNSSAGLQLTYDYQQTLPLVSQITYGSSGNKRVFGYDKFRQLTSDELRTTPANALVSSINYTWDKNGNLEKKTTAGFQGSAVNDYQYDKADRLVSWSNGASTTTYQYDKAGNRTMAGARTFVYNNRNQLVSSDGETKTYQYSPRGTMRGVTQGTVTLDTEADAFGQVLRQESADGVWSTYTYDAIGRAQSTGFAYSGLSNDLAADPTAKYVRGPDDEVIGTQVGAAAGVYAWTDLHTDVVGQFGATSTALNGSTTYDPLGKVVATAGMAGSLGYQSEWTDTPTGRVNMHARWYNTDTGQFDTRDPANVSPTPDSGAANKYAYAGGNPLTRVDPSGNAFMEGCKSIGACLVQGFVNAFDFVEAITGLWNAINDIKRTINNFVNGMKEEAARWRGTIRGMMPCPWWIPNKVCDAAAEIGGWACALSGVCEIVQDCLNALDDQGSRLRCGEHVGEALAQGVQGLISGGAAAVGKFLAKRLLDRLHLPKRHHDHDDDDNDRDNDNGRRGQQARNDDIDDIRELKKYGNKSRGNRNPSTQWKPPGKPKKNNGPKPPPGAKHNGGSKNNRPAEPPKPRQPDPRPQHSAPPPAPDAPGRLDEPSSHSPSGNRNGTGCKHSFNPATPVLMADGSAKPIGDIKLGEKVAATEPSTGVTVAQPVTALHVNLDRDLTDVVVRPVNEGDGGRSTRGPTEATTAPTTTLQTTQNHPFWDVTAQAWVEAKDLKVGESTLTGPDGELLLVTGVHNFTGTSAMRDLTVNSIHTYYVMAGETPVLVHNCNETFYRAMSEKEFNQLGSNGEITVRGTENFVTQSRPYLERLRDTFVRRGGRNAEKYPILVKFEMQPGTRDALIAAGKSSDEIGQDLSAIHLKTERGADNYGLRPGSVDIFNSRIVGFERIDDW